MRRVPLFERLLQRQFGTFGIGAAVPPDRDGMSYSLDEHDSNWRGRRSTLLSGVLLVAIGALVSFRVPIDQPRNT